MDTTHIPYTAEDLISHKLHLSGLLVAKPKFDRDGTDLLAFMNVGDGAKFCRIQCKGRSLNQSSSSNVQVLEKYVTGAFVLFRGVKGGRTKVTALGCFTATLRARGVIEKVYTHCYINKLLIS